MLARGFAPFSRYVPLGEGNPHLVLGTRIPAEPQVATIVPRNPERILTRLRRDEIAAKAIAVAGISFPPRRSVAWPAGPITSIGAPTSDPKRTIPTATHSSAQQ